MWANTIYDTNAFNFQTTYQHFVWMPNWHFWVISSSISNRHGSLVALVLLLVEGRNSYQWRSRIRRHDGRLLFEWNPLMYSPTNSVGRETVGVPSVSTWWNVRIVGNDRPNGGHQAILIPKFSSNDGRLLCFALPITYLHVFIYCQVESKGMGSSSGSTLSRTAYTCRYGITALLQEVGTYSITTMVDCCL